MKRIFLITLILSLSSCAHMPSDIPADDRLQRNRQYQAEGEYRLALKLITETAPDHRQYRKLKVQQPLLLKKIAKLEQKTIAKALKQERKNRWKDAAKSYDEALKKLPESKPLHKAQKSMQQRLDARLEALQLERLIIQGKWLKGELPLSRSLVEMEYDNLLTHWSLIRIENESEEMAEKLLLAGHKALHKGNLSLALRTLPLAVELNPNEESIKANRKLQRALEKRAKNKTKKRQRHFKRLEEKQLQGFYEAIANHKLLKAREYLNQLGEQKPLPHNFDLLEEVLQGAITERVTQELEAGDAFYLNGDFRQAIFAWKNVLSLAPGQKEATGKLERAQRIIGNLQQLHERQAQ
ncbi:MAG: hypothetical protein RPV21_15475, partial [Candidatus Sedimenticola sp. (ex Thyasira tokunagai)]